MPKITYQCKSGHHTTLERDEITKTSIICDICGENIDRFNSKAIVGGGLAGVSEAMDQGKRQKSVVNRMILTINANRKKFILLVISIFAIGVAAFAMVTSQKSKEVIPVQQPFQNKIDEIAYTHTIERSQKQGVYNITFTLSNLGNKDQNQLPSILLDFYPENPKGAVDLPQSLIPTAIFPPSEYAGDDKNIGFTSKQASIEIEFPRGTRAIATCLTYLGAADMKSTRCQEKIFNQLLPQKTTADSK